MEIRLRVDDTAEESVLATELALGRFRLEETPLLGFWLEKTPLPGIDTVYLGDVIEAPPCATAPTSSAASRSALRCGTGRGWCHANSSRRLTTQSSPQPWKPPEETGRG